MSKNGCAVAGCKNNYSNCPPGTRFFSFPSEKRFPGRRELWVNAVRRNRVKISGVYEQSWLPSKHSRVCSRHFVGGFKRDHPYHVNYVPHIFPNSDVSQRNNLIGSSEWKIGHELEDFIASTVALSNNDTVALSDNDTVALSDNDTVALSDNDEVALSDKDTVVLSNNNKVAIKNHGCKTEIPNTPILKSTDVKEPAEWNYCNIPILFCSITDAGSSTQTFIPILSEMSQSTQTEDAYVGVVNSKCKEEPQEEDKDLKRCIKIESVLRDEFHGIASATTREKFDEDEDLKRRVKTESVFSDDELQRIASAATQQEFDEDEYLKRRVKIESVLSDDELQRIALATTQVIPIKLTRAT